MSRQAQLPPRCPIQKKQVSPLPCNEVLHPSSPIESNIGHVYGPSSPRLQNTTSVEQPVWLNDLLGDSTNGANSMGAVPLRRSSSDSVVLVGDLLNSLSSLNPTDDDEISGSETCGGVDSACVYGPSSPKRKNSSTFLNKSIASAFSGYISQNPHPCLDDGFTENAFGSECPSFADTNTPKWHPGQRSRVRKLQYIAELEKTASMLQNVETDLSVRVASLLQRRVALSLENSHLMQQIGRVKQAKLAKEGEYQTLKEEAQRLKLGLATYPSYKARTLYGSGSSAKVTGSGIDWKMLDLGNLNLN